MANILIIEDAENLATVLQQELKKNGYTAYHTLTGEAGLTYIQEQPVNLVILDWMLPGIDGLAVLREIQKTTDIPAILSSASYWRLAPSNY